SRRPYWRQGWPRAIAPVGTLQLAPFAGATGLPFGLALVAANRPLAGGLGHGLAMGGRPCMGAGRGWPPLLLAAFTAKT
ncbi:hypothetical protein BHE74_00027739, partial [Ensete ventricosum]